MTETKLKSRRERNLIYNTKVVIRRLPPSMTEEEFIEVVGPLPENDYFRFVAADKSLGPFGFTRAYLNFKNHEEVFDFRDKFDSYVFVDQKGNEYPAIVEYASFQKTPKKNSCRKDSRCGTIDQDADYIAFLQALENPEPLPTGGLEALVEEIERKERELKANNGVIKIKTPLLEFIEQRRAEKARLRDEKREERNRLKDKRVKQRENRRRKDFDKKKDDKWNNQWEYKEEKGDKNRNQDDSPTTEMYKKVKNDIALKKKVRHKDDGYQKSEDEQPSAKHKPGSEEKKIDSGKSKRYSEARRKDEKRRTESDKKNTTSEKLEKEKKSEIVKKDKKVENNLDKCKIVEKEIKSDAPETSSKSLKESPKKTDEAKTVTDTSEVISDTVSKQSEDLSDHKNIDQENIKDTSTEAKTLENSSAINSDESSVIKNQEKSVAKDEFVDKSEIEDKGESPNKEEVDIDESKTSREETETERETTRSPDDLDEIEKAKKRDLRAERRIRNKDRPAMQIYRPGQSRLSNRPRNNVDDSPRGDSSSSSPSPVMPADEPKYDKKSIKKSKETTSRKRYSELKRTNRPKSDDLSTDKDGKKSEDCQSPIEKEQDDGKDNNSKEEINDEDKIIKDDKENFSVCTDENVDEINKPPTEIENTNKVVSERLEGDQSSVKIKDEPNDISVTEESINFSNDKCEIKSNSTVDKSEVNEKVDIVSVDKSENDSKDEIVSESDPTEEKSAGLSKTETDLNLVTEKIENIILESQVD